MRRRGDSLDNERLYSLGRAYVRKKYEDALEGIEKNGAQTDSETLVLKQVFKFFNYCNPLGLRLDPDMPRFDAAIVSNAALQKRWQDLAAQALGDAASMFDYGDKMYGPQIYELGRALFLSKLHSPAPGPDDREFDQEEWNALREAFHILSYLNSPGGPNLSYAPDFVPNARPRARKAKLRAVVERILRDNRDALGVGDGLISFLTGSPSAWSVVSARLGNSPSREAVMRLAARSNAAMAKAAAAYTDIQNAETANNGQTLVFANFVDGDAYASFLPPAIRIHYLRAAGSPDEPAPERMALNMTGFEENARLYGLEGWQGIGRRFLSERGGEAATMDDFAAYLDKTYVLLQRPDLGERADAPLDAYLADATGEARLGDAFSAASIFSTW